jgi:peroxiredoxin
MKFLKLSFALMLSMVSALGYAQLPSVQLKSIDGKVVDTATLSNDGKPYVISFFATWCKPCNRELKAIHEVYPDWQDETGMRLIAISIDEAQNAQKVKPLVDSEGWEYEVFLDPNSDFFHALGGQMIPFVVTVDGNGKIVESHSGYIDGAESHIIEQIRDLVK